MAKNVDPDQTAPIGAVCSGSTLYASILNSSVMFGNYLQQTPSADDIFRCIFFLVLKGSKLLQLAPLFTTRVNNAQVTHSRTGQRRSHGYDPPSFVGILIGP